MDSTVTLIVTRGPLAGRKFVFDEPTVCLIGRSRDCSIALPLEAEHMDVSRHHCLVEIAAPSVRVRDLGSLNGTYVNGRKIGQRRASLAPADVEGTHQPVVALIDGDEIRLGEHVAFRVCVFTSEQEESARTHRHSSGELQFEVPVPS
ncbi:MAG TPA: FHA domain-containing protein [Gemmataceae bacterium]|nr:FHA domain-containing protein [Gemmataceae bacterium]